MQAKAIGHNYVNCQNYMGHNYVQAITTGHNYVGHNYRP